MGYGSGQLSVFSCQWSVVSVHLSVFICQCSFVSGEFGDESREFRLFSFYELELTYMTYLFKN
jgi:hypothetical protein